MTQLLTGTYCCDRGGDAGLEACALKLCWNLHCMCVVRCLLVIALFVVNIYTYSLHPHASGMAGGTPLPAKIKCDPILVCLPACLTTS